MVRQSLNSKGSIQTQLLLFFNSLPGWVGQQKLGDKLVLPVFNQLQDTVHINIHVVVYNPVVQADGGVP